MIKQSLKKTFPFFAQIHQYPALRAFGWLSLGILISSKISIDYTHFSIQVVVLILAIIAHKKTTIPFLIVGMLFTSAENQEYASKIKELNNFSNQTVTIHFQSSPRYTTKEGTVETVTIASGRCRGIVEVTFLEPIMPGEQIQCSGSFSSFDTASTPWSSSLYQLGKRSGIHGIFTIDTIFSRSQSNEIVYTLSNVLNQEINAYNSPTKGMLKALFRADRSEINRGVKEIFKRSGIAHLLALSGQHIAILVFIIALLLKPFPIPRQIAILSTIALPWLILVITGPSASIIRALLMSSLLLATFFTKRKLSPWNTLGSAGTLYLICFPQELFTPGFLLSFCAVAAIIGIVTVVNNRTANHTLRKIMIFILIPVAAGISTAPVTAYFFGTTVQIGIVANLILTPLFNFYFVLAIPLFVFGIQFTSLSKALEYLTEQFIILAQNLITLLNMPPTEFSVVSPQMVLIPIIVVVILLTNRGYKRVVLGYITLVSLTIQVFNKAIRPINWKNETISFSRSNEIDILKITTVIPNQNELIRYLKKSSCNRSIIIELPENIHSSTTWNIEKFTAYKSIFIIRPSKQNNSDCSSRSYNLCAQDTVKSGSTIFYPFQM